METLLKSLNECIDRQLNLYRKLLDLFLTERHAILASELEELNAVVMEREPLPHCALTSNLPPSDFEIQMPFIGHHVLVLRANLNLSITVVRQTSETNIMSS